MTDQYQSLIELISDSLTAAMLRHRLPVSISYRVNFWLDLKAKKVKLFLCINLL